MQTATANKNSLFLISPGSEMKKQISQMTLLQQLGSLLN